MILLSREFQVSIIQYIGESCPLNFSMSLFNAKGRSDFGSFLVPWMKERKRETLKVQAGLYG